MARKSSKEATEITDKSLVRVVKRAAARESLAILLFAAAMFLFICLLSYDFRDPSLNVATTRSYVANLGGILGSHIADALVQALGVSSLLVPLVLVILSLKLVLPGRRAVRWSEIGCMIVLIGVISMSAERLLIAPVLKFTGLHAGGAIGNFFHVVTTTFLGSGGELLFSATIMCLCILHISKVTVQRVLRFFGWVGTVFKAIFAAGWTRLKTAYNNNGKSRFTPDHDDYLGPYKEIDASHPDFNELGLPKNQPFDDEQIVKMATLDASWEESHKEQDQRPFELDWFEQPKDTDDALTAAAEDFSARQALPRSDRSARESASLKNVVAITVKELEKSIEEYLNRKSSNPAGANKKAYATHKASLITVTRRADENISKTNKREEQVSSEDDYKFPPVELLDSPSLSDRHVDNDLLESNAAILEQKLADLGVRGEVVAVHPGPVITMYELNLAPGVPLRKVINTSDDLAMALKSGSTRVVAPIHGKNTVGIEVPNLNREIVYFLKHGLRTELALSGAPILIDCCPMLGVLTLNALLACDRVLIPVSADFLSLQGVYRLDSALNVLEKKLQRSLERRIVVTRFDSRRKLSYDIYDKLKERYGALVCNTRIGEHVVLATSPMHNIDVFAYAPHSPGAADYMALTRELLDSGFFTNAP